MAIYIELDPSTLVKTDAEARAITETCSSGCTTFSAYSSPFSTFSIPSPPITGQMQYVPVYQPVQKSSSTTYLWIGIIILAILVVITMVMVAIK